MGEFEDKLNGVLNNPQEMEKIVTLARSLMGGGETTQVQAAAPPPPPASVPAPSTGSSGISEMLGNIDPGMVKKLAQGLSGGVGSAALLKAMTPHLKDARQGQLKRALAIAQVVKAAKAVFTD